MSEKEEVKVVVGGKVIPLKDLKKQYAELTISGVRGNVKLMQLLAQTEKPLTRHDIAKETNMTPGYVADRLKKLAKQGYILEFVMGKVRFKYYLLTEKGLDLLRKSTK